MTKAERMKEVTKKAIEEQRAKVIEKNRKYANKLINGKVYKRALKGYNNCEIKISRFYIVTFVVEEFEKNGFEVKRNSKNGKTVLAIKW